LRTEDCTYCDHFELREDHYWSEETGSDPARIGCGKGHWSLGEDDRYGSWTTKQFRLKVLQGKTCADFKLTVDP
jgi:hypothetical protein